MTEEGVNGVAEDAPVKASCREQPCAPVQRRVFTAMLTVGGFTLLAAAATALKDILVARQFGVRDSLDAFLIAYLLPSSAVNVVAGSFSLAFVPTYTEVRSSRGKEAAERLLAGALASAGVLLAALSLALALLGPFLLPLLGSGFSPEKLALTRSLYYWLLPTLPLLGLSTLWSAVLNAHERFSLAAIAPAAPALATILLLICAGRTWGIYSLATGSLLGSAVAAGSVAWGLRRQGLSLAPRWQGLDAAHQRMLAQFAPAACGALLMTFWPVVDSAFAASAGPGSVSALRYGSKVASMLASIGAMALGTAAFPYLSRLVADGDWHGLRRLLRVYSCLTLAAAAPVVLIGCLFATPIVRLFFQRGAFTPDAVPLVAMIHRYYLLQLPFYVLNVFYVRLVSAIKANHILLNACALCVLLNLALDWAFLKTMGVPGLALSTSIVYLVSCCYCANRASHVIRTLEGSSES